MERRAMRTAVAGLVLLALGATLGCSQSSATRPATAGAGKVTITYTLSRISKIASNQYAIWIEDEKGAYVRTLFVTDFTARKKGWQIRAQALPLWVKAADIKNTPQASIDAVSGATPRRGGVQTAFWDLRDRSGKPVAPGTYTYRIEGNIYWDNEVMWTGTIQIGGGRSSSSAAVTYSPATAAEQGGPLITDVSAVYEP